MLRQRAGTHEVGCFKRHMCTAADQGGNGQGKVSMNAINTADRNVDVTQFCCKTCHSVPGMPDSAIWGSCAPCPAAPGAVYSHKSCSLAPPDGIDVDISAINITSALVDHDRDQHLVSCSPRLVTLVLVLLFLGITTMLTSARSLPDCQTGSSCSTAAAAAISRRWFGFGATDAPWYPSGYCATECSWNPAQQMRHCAGDAAAAIPTTSCQPVDDDDSVCPTMRYLDAV